jgi:DivIVA domain-containing protein
MADEPRIVISSEPSLGAEEVARRTFATSFRGYDPAEVRAFLRRVADELGALREREADLRRRLEESQRRAATPPSLDEAALMTALGEETARVLRSAREAAAEITRKAEQKVAAIVRDAQEEAARLREEAEGLLARRSEEAEEAAAALRAEAEAEAAAIRARARAEAEALLEEARATGRSMVQEAQALRERVLADLARRRRLAQVHVEQLRAGRERLLDAYRLVRRTLDEVTDELGRAEVEARAAAEEAGRRAAAEAGATLQELEAELAAARAELAEEAGEQGGLVSPEPAGEGAMAAPPATGGAAAPAAGGEPAPTTSPTGTDGVAPPDQPRTLRLARRGSDDVVELPVVEAPGDEEAVRVLREPPGGGASRGSGDEGAPVPQGPAAGAVAPHGAAPPAAAPEGENPAAQPVQSVQPGEPGEPGHGASPAAEAAARAEPAAPGAGGPARDIDALFARIRADRERAVAEAEVVLAGAEPATAAGRESDDGTVEVPAGEAVPLEEHAAVGDGDEARLQRRDELLEPLEAALVRRLKRVLQDEQNAVLDALRTRRGLPRAEEVLPGPAEQLDAYRREAAPILSQAVEAGAIFNGGTVALAADVGVEAVAVDLAAEVVTMLRERVARALDATADDGGDAAESISAAYREWRLQRIEPAARHAVATAFALGSYVAQPDGTTVRWLVDDDGRPCPDCDDNALAGPTVKGEAFPTGQRHPPAHPGCRCLLVPAAG